MLGFFEDKDTFKIGHAKDKDKDNQLVYPASSSMLFLFKPLLSRLGKSF